MRAENVVLPQNGYFGISAATGGLADDHDVLKFSVTSLRSLDEAKNLAVDPEFQKNQDEFEEYEKKLKTQKDQWKKDNPEEVRKIHFFLNCSCRFLYPYFKGSLISCHF